MRFDGSTNMIAVELRLQSSMSEKDAVVLEYQDLERRTSMTHPFPAYIDYLMDNFQESLVGNDVDVVDAFTSIISRDDGGHLVTRNLAWKFMATFCEDEGQEWEFRVGADFGKGGEMFVDDTQISIVYGDLDWKQSYSNKAGLLTGKIFLDAGKHHMAVFGLESCCGGPSSVSFRRTAKGDDWREFSRENLLTICETQGFEKFVMAAQTTEVEGCSHAGIECEAAIEDLQVKFPDMGYQELGVLSERGLTADNYLTDTSVQQYLFDFEPYTDCTSPCIDLLPKMITGHTPENMEGWRCIRTNELLLPNADGTTWTDMSYDHSEWAAPDEQADYVATSLLAHTDSVLPKWVGVEDSANPLSGETAFAGCFSYDILDGVTLIKSWADSPFSRSHAPENCRSECGLTDYFSIGRVEVAYEDDNGEAKDRIEINCYCVESYDIELQLTTQDDTLCGTSIEVGGLGEGTCNSKENLDANQGPQWCIDGSTDDSIGVFRASFDTTYCVYSFEELPPVVSA